MKQIMFSIYMLVSLVLLSRFAYSADNLAGTYTVRGTKGDITLMLRQDQEGNINGSLKGGNLSLQLKGFPQEGGGYLGTAKNDAGQMMSYFRAVRQGNQVLLDLIEANADGEPDLNKSTRIPFPAGSATINPPNEENAEDANDANITPPTSNTTGSPYAGTFKGTNLTLESQAVQGGYKGTIRLGDQTFPFTGNARNGTLVGTFETKDGRFDFTAKLQGSTLELSTEGTKYTLQKQGGNSPAKNPLAQPKPPVKNNNPLAKPALSAQGSTSGQNKLTQPVKTNGPTGTTNTRPQPVGGPGQGANWKSYKHPVGLSMRYPSNWSARELPGGAGMQLVPPDVATTAAGPSEVYLILGSGAEGVTSVEDPRVVPTLERQMAQLAPTLQRAGAPESIKAGNAPGLLLNWEGQHATTGAPVSARVLVTVLKGYILGLVAIGDKNKVTARNQTVRGIFASFAAGEGQKDQRIVGSWKFWSYSSSADGRYGRETTRYMVLRPDGVVIWSDKSESSGVFKAGSIAGQYGDADQGTWSAANGQLYVLWQNGTESRWTYQMGGNPGSRKLLLQDANSKKPDEWMENR